MLSKRANKMGAFLSYSLISGLFMLSMYLAYRVFLARENQHGFNRVVLLLIYGISFLSLTIASAFSDLFSESSATQMSMGNIDIPGSAVVTVDAPLWGTVLIWIFAGGMLVITVKSLITWYLLRKVINTGEKMKCDGYTLVIVDSDRFSPFSWIRYMVISKRDYEEDNRSIITHELKHISCRHWLDLLLAQAVCIINWFNPVAWLMRDEIMLTHEYQADMAVMNSGYDAPEYQRLLIKKAVGARFPSLANSLNHSKLKKRITMMYKEKSCAVSKLKALALVPTFALAIGVVAVPSVKAAVSTISNSELIVSKDSQKDKSDKASVKIFRVTNINNNGNVTNVTIVGEGLGDNLTVSGGTFTTLGKTYNATALGCTLINGKATIIATFPFTDEYENSSMTLQVNGEEIPFNLENFFNNAQTISVNSEAGKQPGNAFVIHGSDSEGLDGMEIYVDGKKITQSELKGLAPDKIASIEIDKNKKAIKVILKK